MKALYELDKNKSEEIHFTVGEALSCVVSGASSSAARDPLHPPIDDIDEDQEGRDDGKGKTAQQKEDKQQPSSASTSVGPPVMTPVLDKLFSLLQSGSNVSRGSAAIWLLSLLQHSSGSRELRNKLPLIQAHFSRLLSGI